MQLCCIFLLLFAQQGALTHALWHAAQGAPANGQQAAGAPSQDREKPDLAGSCAFDAAYGQVLGTAAGSPTGAFVPLFTHATPRHSHHSIVARRFLAPLSRGPPSLL